MSPDTRLRPRLNNPALTKAVLAVSDGLKYRVGRVWHRRVLVLGLGLPGLLAMFELGLLVWILLDPHQRLNPLVESFISSGEINSVRQIQWFIARLTIDGMTGLITLTAAILLLTRNERLGVELGDHQPGSIADRGQPDHLLPGPVQSHLEFSAPVWHALADAAL